MNIKIKICVTAAALLLGIAACREEGRYTAGMEQTHPPGKVSNVTFVPLYGGARFYYTVPPDEDLLRVEAEYTGQDSRTHRFTASYFSDSLDVYGFRETAPQEVRLCAVNRAGQRSEPVSVSVTPLEPAYLRVAESIVVKPGFSSFFLDWENELKQNVNVYVDFSYTQGGTSHSLTTVFSSNLPKDRRFVNDLFLSSSEPVSVKVRVEDLYGNMTPAIDKGQIRLHEDSKIPKDRWVLPAANDSIGGVPMMFGYAYEGRTPYVIDDIIDWGDNNNYLNTSGNRGRTGRPEDGSNPWNLIIDMGDYYELSRIITVQRHGILSDVSRGDYYYRYNVAIYRVYIWDDEKQGWSDMVRECKIEAPMELTEIEIARKGKAGDMFYFYPDDPQYTKPTRWFRYEALFGFQGNYTSKQVECLSELTLYGRKANK
jgi:hypothetical protein